MFRICTRCAKPVGVNIRHGGEPHRTLHLHRSKIILFNAQSQSTTQFSTVIDSTLNSRAFDYSNVISRIVKRGVASSSTSTPSSEDLANDFEELTPEAEIDNLDLDDEPESQFASPTVADSGDHSKLKLAKISRAMKVYLQNAKEQEEFMKKEVAAFELGKRHLANMMSLDADTMTQEDIDKAISYLLPSGLFSIRARPIFKHPSQLFPKPKEAEFHPDGRPKHTLFYTRRPAFYQLIHDIGRKTKNLDDFENRERSRNSGVLGITEQITLTGSVWIKQIPLSYKVQEQVDDEMYNQFLTAMEHLVTRPFAIRERDFILGFRESIGETSSAQDWEVLPLQYDENGRPFVTQRGMRKSTVAEVTVYGNGSGKVLMNGQSFTEMETAAAAVRHFLLQTREQLLAPFLVLDCLGEFDVIATTERTQAYRDVPHVHPERSWSSQSGAVRVGIARALCSFVSEREQQELRLAGLLTQDPRKHERMKPGQKGARAKWIWKKR